MSRLHVSFGKSFKRESKESAELASHSLINRIAQVVAKPSSPGAFSFPRPESRRARRFKPRYCRSSLTLNSGEKHEALIVNVSRFGVLVHADFKNIVPSDVIQIGSTDVKHVRRVDGGAAFTFAKELSLRACDEYLVL